MGWMVDVSVPLQVSNSIVFLNARLAMTFISVRFGTAKMVRRTLGFEGWNNMITVLWMEQPVSYLQYCKREPEADQESANK